MTTSEYKPRVVYVGPSQDLRVLIADQELNPSNPIVLTAENFELTVTVLTITVGAQQLIIRCRSDKGEKCILHLPYAKGSEAYVTILS